MALAIATVADSISKLTVSGVILKDIDEIPSSVADRDTPMIIPRPDGFISNFRFQRDSFGAGGDAKITVRYTLLYRLLAAKVGSGRGLFDVYDTMITKTGLFLDAIIANDAITGAVDIIAAGVENVGGVGDPAGNIFHGCDISIDVMEFVN